MSKTTMQQQKLTGYPSIDKPWLKYYSEEAIKASTRDESIFQMLERYSQNRLNHTALELRLSKNGFKKGPQITYSEYIDRIKKLASRIKAKFNTTVDEIVPVIIPNLPESRIIIYALNYIGATVYPINPMLSTNVFESILSDNNVKTVAIFNGFWEKFSDSIVNSKVENIIVLDGFEFLPKPIKTILRINRKLPNDHRVISYDKLFSSKSCEKVMPYYAKDHIAVIIGTSGTTGTSKGVCMTDDNLNALALGQMISDHYRTGDIALDILIQSIGYGISTAHSFGVIGCHAVLIPELVTDKIPDLLCEVKPDTFPGGPVHYINLAHSRQFQEGKLPLVRTAFSGGATLEKEIEKLLNSADEGYMETQGSVIRVRQGYGSTECGGAATANTYGAYKFGSIGIPMANIIVSIFKPGTDEELKYGEQGEICVSGPTVMKCYLNNTEETNNVLRKHSDGSIWLHQADLGWCDEDGHFYMTDRIKNIFMRTGFNVHPSKISEFIISLPEIQDCVVVGIQHPKEQMVPVAFCVLNAGYEKEEILDKLKLECSKNLSETDIPYEWRFVDNLPRNMGGKIDTKVLVEQSGIDYMK